MNARPAAGVATRLEINHALQRYSEIAIELAKGRTVQEHPLFPMPAYTLASYVDAYWQFPELLRRLEATASAEEIGARARAVPCAVTRLSLLCVYGFYTLGREIHIGLGLAGPEDRLDDLALVTSWWRRGQLALSAQSGRQFALDSGGIDEIFSTEEVDRVRAGLVPVDDELAKQVGRVAAGLTAQSFLTHCESRLGQAAHGPYPLGGGRVLLVRSWSELGGGSMPWSDVYHDDMPYNTLTLAMELEDTDVRIDDWGTPNTTPAAYLERLRSVALLTSDPLADTFDVVEPSHEVLMRQLTEIADNCRVARRKLFLEFSDWSWADLLDAGAIMHLNVLAEPFKIAGCYHEDLTRVTDERTERLLPFLNDEVASEYLGLRFPHLRRGPYHLNPSTRRAAEPLSLVPLTGEVAGSPSVDTGTVEPRLRLTATRKGERLAREAVTVEELNRRASAALAEDRRTGRRLRTDSTAGWLEHRT